MFDIFDAESQQLSALINQVLPPLYCRAKPPFITLLQVLERVVVQRPEIIEGLSFSS